MNIGSAFPSSYLKAADIPAGRSIAVKISGVAMEDIGGDHKPILYFEGKEKGLVLNKTNANMITEIAGTPETDSWAGVQIALYSTKVDFQGRRVDAIRVGIAQNGNGQKQPTPPPVQQRQEPGDDDIPF